MNEILIENIKLKSDLQFDLLYESSFYESLDPELKSFLKESYDSGVDLGISLIKQNPILLESMDEGLWDRFKAGVARTGQGLKNISGIGTPSADSKDAGVDSLLNSFKQKFEKTKQSAGQDGPDPSAAVADEIEKLDKKTQTAPPVDPNTANKIIQQSNVPKSLKDKLFQAIRDNPKKTALIIGGLNMAAGALGTLAPMPGAAALSGAVSNTIAQAIVNKAHGKPAMDNFVKNALKGAAMGGLGAGLKAGIANAIHSAGQTVKTPVPSSQGWADTSDANSPEVAVTQQQSAVSPEDLRNPEQPETDQWADTSDANSPEVAVTQQQSAVSPEDLRNPDTDVDTELTQQPVAQQPAQTAPVQPTQPKVEPGTAPARVANDAAQQAKYYKSRGYTGPTDTLGRPKALFRENKESMFVKSYNNIYVFKKSLNENIEEKWNEEVEQPIEEALNPEQTKIYNEFLADLGKMFKKPPGEIIAFMQSQGDRFKNVLDYINQNVTPTGVGGGAPGGAAAPGAVPTVLPGQPGAQPVGGESDFKMDANQLKNVKIFLSKLIELGNVLNKTNAQNLDKATLKNLAISSLSIGDILVNKNGAGKSNAALDKVLQGIDILGQLPPPKVRQASTTGPVSSVFKEDVGGYKNPALTKQITALKDSPLFKGLQQRLVNLLGFAQFDSRTGASVNNLDNRESIIALRKVLSDVNNVMIKFSPQVSQKLGGNPAAIKKELEADKGFVKEVASEQQRVKFITELNAAMPLIVGLMSSLRQTFNRKNPNNIYKQDIKPATDNKPEDKKAQENPKTSSNEPDALTQIRQLKKQIDNKEPIKENKLFNLIDNKNKNIFKKK